MSPPTPHPSPPSRNPAQRSPAAYLREPGAWSLLLLGTVYFHRVLFFGQTLYLRDLYLYFLPQKALVADAWRNATLPLWNPNLHGGMPLLADISNSALYPSNLLYLLMPTVQAFNLDIVLHTIVASLAAYLLARTLGLGQIAAWVAGIGFAYCGFALSLTNFMVVHLARPYLPLMVLCWHRFLAGDGRRWWIATALLGGLQILAGGPEMIAITHLTLGGWTVARWIADRTRSPWRLLRAGTALGAMVATVIALGAVQLLPMLDLVAGGERGSGFRYEDWSRWSLPLWRLPELVVAGFFGPVDTYAAADYWGMNRVDFGYPYMLSVYFGAGLLALAVLGAISPPRLTAPLPHPFVRLLAALAVISGLVALGRAWPFFELLFDTLPPVRLFRFPIKALGLATLPVALLAGLGLDRLVHRDSEPARGLGRLLSIRLVIMTMAAVGSFSGMAAVLTLGLPRVSGPILQTVFGRSDEAVHAGLTTVLGHTALFALLAAAIMWALSNPSHSEASAPTRQRWLLISLAGLLALDLLIAGRATNPAAPADLVTDPPPAIAAIREAVGTGRLYRTLDPAVELPVPTNEAIWRYRFNIDGLAHYLGASFGLPVIFHADYNGLAPQPIVKLEEVIKSLPWERRLGMLAAAGVSAVITAEAPDVPGLAIRHRFEASGRTLQLYQNTQQTPDASLVGIWQPARDQDHALRALAHPRFDPRLHVVIDDPTETLPKPSTACLDPEPQARVVARDPRQWSITTKSACDRILVLQQRLDNGWQVNVDGAPARALRANLAFAAVRLPAGEHQIIWRYTPPGLVLGAALSILTLLGLGVLLATDRIRAARSRR